jgi:hypothetical protein
MRDRPAIWTQWIVVGTAFAIGAIIGGSLLIPTFSTGWEKIPWPIQWLLMPGILLLAPAWVLTGGVHGDYGGSLFDLVPWANGLAYALLAAGIRLASKRRRRKKAESSAG